MRAPRSIYHARLTRTISFNNPSFPPNPTLLDMRVAMITTPPDLDTCLAQVMDRHLSLPPSSRYELLQLARANVDMILAACCRGDTSSPRSLAPTATCWPRVVPMLTLFF